MAKVFERFDRGRFELPGHSVSDRSLNRRRDLHGPAHGETHPLRWPGLPPEIVKK
jgi:hypothetical protein